MAHSIHIFTFLILITNNLCLSIGSILKDEFRGLKFLRSISFIVLFINYWLIELGHSLTQLLYETPVTDRRMKDAERPLQRHKFISVNMNILNHRDFFNVAKK